MLGTFVEINMLTFGELKKTLQTIYSEIFSTVSPNRHFRKILSFMLKGIESLPQTQILPNGVHL